MQKALDRLDEMNEAGVIKYDIYSELHDLISGADVVERSKINKAIEELQHIKVYDRTRTARLVSLPDVLDVFKRNIGE